MLVIKKVRTIMKDNTCTFDFTNDIPTEKIIVGAFFRGKTYALPYISLSPAVGINYANILRIYEESIQVQSINTWENYEWTFILFLVKS